MKIMTEKWRWNGKRWKFMRAKLTVATLLLVVQRKIKYIGSDMVNQELKNHRRYILYRLFAVALVLLILFIKLYPIGCNGLVVFLSIPFLGYVVVNVIVFPFNYSVLGAYERNQGNDSGPLVDSCSVSMPRQLPLFTYSLYQNGLEVGVLFMGSVFIHYNEIHSITDAPKIVGGCILRHNSPKIRSSLRISDSELCKKLRERIYRTVE